MKCMVKEHPLYFVMAGYAGCTFLFGYIIRICEYDMNDIAGTGMNFKPMVNSFWCAFISMTSVGYGDFYPHTLIGRIWMMVIAFVGVFFEANFIIAIQ